jgi:hypothetical protein
MIGYFLGKFKLIKSRGFMLIQTDYVGWLNETITLLKQKNFDKVDWENLSEEIESLLVLG